MADNPKPKKRALKLTDATSIVGELASETALRNSPRLTALSIERAAELMSQADAVLACVGPWSSLDSGLDPRLPLAALVGFRAGPTGPPLPPSGEQAASAADSTRERMTAAIPHEGLGCLLRLVDELPGGYFIATDTVDGLLHRAGFEPGRVLESRGDVFYDQCTAGCGRAPWPAPGGVSRCRACGAPARPHLRLDVDGWPFDSAPRDAAWERFTGWLEHATTTELLVLDLGTTPEEGSVRGLAERYAQGRTMVRINSDPELAKVGSGDVSIVASVRAGLTAIDRRMRARYKT